LIRDLLIRNSLISGSSNYIGIQFFRKNQIVFFFKTKLVNYELTSHESTKLRRKNKQYRYKTLSKVKVIKSGLLTTIQDKGRFGYRKLGIPQSGVLDNRAYRQANWLVNNALDAPVLECTLQGGIFRFERAGVIAITGADMAATLNGLPCEMNRSIGISRGEVLELGYARTGTRSYIGIQGVPDIERVMGSYSTYVLGGFGGFQGRALQAGDSFEWGRKKPNNPNRKLPEYVLPHFFNKKNIIRIMRGPEWEWLSLSAQRLLGSTFYTIHTDSNRMGIRLVGEELSLTNDLSMTSSATLPGTVQLLPNGQPIVLMHDGQTTGGYPRIAKVIEADLGRLAQIPPKGSLCFRWVNEVEASALFLHKKGSQTKFSCLI